jgi:hypothetical protein
MILLVKIIVMFLSFFMMICLMNDKSKIVNHKLCLYNMPFLLSWIVWFLSFNIYRSRWYLCCSMYNPLKQGSLQENVAQFLQKFLTFLLY